MTVKTYEQILEERIEELHALILHMSKTNDTVVFYAIPKDNVKIHKGTTATYKFFYNNIADLLNTYSQTCDDYITTNEYEKLSEKINWIVEVWRINLRTKEKERII